MTRRDLTWRLFAIVVGISLPLNRSNASQVVQRMRVAKTDRWPDATSTGVPVGVTLTPYNGNLVITTPGAVISGLDIHGIVTVNAPGVTIENCRITNNNSSAWYVILTYGDTIVQDCTIDGGGAGANGINGGGTFLRNNISNLENGIDPDDNTLIQDNYIHDLHASGWPHYDGIELGGYDNQDNIIIRHNTVDMGNLGQTGAVNLTNDFGSISNVTIDNNLLKGGSYTIYTDNSHGGGPIANITITNNVIKPGQFGYFYFKTTKPTHNGNKDFDSGRALDRPGALRE
jgi:hypothetical protein